MSSDIESWNILRSCLNSASDAEYECASEKGKSSTEYVTGRASERCTEERTARE
jgi:hypothetical protein